MAIVFKNGDMFTSDAPYLCHQVNCMGKMGSGIARTVREKFPNAYHDYMTLCLFGGKTTKQLLESHHQYVWSGNLRNFRSAH